MREDIKELPEGGVTEPPEPSDDEPEEVETPDEHALPTGYAWKDGKVQVPLGVVIVADEKQAGDNFTLEGTEYHMWTHTYKGKTKAVPIPKDWHNIFGVSSLVTAGDLMTEAMLIWKTPTEKTNQWGPHIKDQGETYAVPTDLLDKFILGNYVLNDIFAWDGVNYKVYATASNVNIFLRSSVSIFDKDVPTYAKKMAETVKVYRQKNFVLDEGTGKWVKKQKAHLMMGQIKQVIIHASELGLGVGATFHFKGRDWMVQGKDGKVTAVVPADFSIYDNAPNLLQHKCESAFKSWGSVMNPSPNWEALLNHVDAEPAPKKWDSMSEQALFGMFEAAKGKTGTFMYSGHEVYAGYSQGGVKYPVWNNPESYAPHFTDTSKGAAAIFEVWKKWKKKKKSEQSPFEWDGTGKDTITEAMVNAVYAHVVENKIPAGNSQASIFTLFGHEWWHSLDEGPLPNHGYEWDSNLPSWNWFSKKWSAFSQKVAESTPVAGTEALTDEYLWPAFEKGEQGGYHEHDHWDYDDHEWLTVKYSIGNGDKTPKPMPVPADYGWIPGYTHSPSNLYAMNAKVYASYQKWEDSKGVLDPSETFYEANLFAMFEFVEKAEAEGKVDEWKHVMYKGHEVYVKYHHAGFTFPVYNKKDAYPDDHTWNNSGAIVLPIWQKWKAAKAAQVTGITINGTTNTSFEWNTGGWTTGITYNQVSTAAPGTASNGKKFPKWGPATGKFETALGEALKKRLGPYATDSMVSEVKKDMLPVLREYWDEVNAALVSLKMTAAEHDTDIPTQMPGWTLPKPLEATEKVVPEAAVPAKEAGAIGPTKFESSTAIWKSALSPYLKKQYTQRIEFGIAVGALDKGTTLSTPYIDLWIMAVKKHQKKGEPPMANDYFAATAEWQDALEGISA